MWQAEMAVHCMASGTAGVHCTALRCVENNIKVSSLIEREREYTDNRTGSLDGSKQVDEQQYIVHNTVGIV